MKILLQHETTGLYWKSPGVWVAEPQEAYDFPSSTHAERLQQAHRLAGVRMIFKFEREGYYIRVPLAATAAYAV